MFGRQSQLAGHLLFGSRHERGENSTHPARPSTQQDGPAKWKDRTASRHREAIGVGIHRRNATKVSSDGQHNPGAFGCIEQGIRIPGGVILRWGSVDHIEWNATLFTRGHVRIPDWPSDFSETLHGVL